MLIISLVFSLYLVYIRHIVICDMNKYMNKFRDISVCGKIMRLYYVSQFFMFGRVDN